ncbi:putative pre-mRNA-splicing factor 38B [Sesbania bispinosa]|nr:putative pre-mRNA-splicing factor 38B [Sesbania bispinosa]
MTEIGAAGTGTGTERETAKDIEIGTRIEIMRGTESGGIRSGTERESGVMIMIGGPGTQREKVAGITTTAVAMAGDGSKKTSASSNLAKLKDMYGDLGDNKGDANTERIPRRDNGGEEVIRLGGSTWKY